MASKSIGKPSLYVERFLTWGDYLAKAEHGDRSHATAKGRNSSRRNERGRSWSGTDTFEEALRLAREGWPEGEAMVRSIASRLEASMINKIVREDWNYEVEGMGFDVARYIEGEPEHWYAVEETQLEGPHRNVRIVMNLAASSGVAAEILAARGAAVAALVELLEYAGIRCEVWTVMAASGVYEAYCKVKPYDQPLEPSRIAFALANPANFRRLHFALIEATPPAVNDWLSFGYGTPTNGTDVQEGNVVVPEAMYGQVQWESPERAIAWIKDILVAQGVRLED